MVQVRSGEGTAPTERLVSPVCLTLRGMIEDCPVSEHMALVFRTLQSFYPNVDGLDGLIDFTQSTHNPFPCVTRWNSVMDFVLYH